MEERVLEAVDRFRLDYGVTTKGSLSLVVQLTDALKRRERPWRPQDFLTGEQGQVSGLGGPNLKKILARHGVTRTLATEGGRTSRGNMGLMIKYVEFMNELADQGDIDYTAVEAYWVEQVKNYFNNQPFTLSSDTSHTIATNLEDLFDQARKRQLQNPGTQYLGTLLQHLVGAKLSTIMPSDTLEPHGASVADTPTGRSGDFVIKDTVIHCTTAPGEPLILKCKANIKAGAHPVIITLFERVRTTLDLATDAGLGGKVEVWDIQQFLSANISERSLFDGGLRNLRIAEIVASYNEIVDKVETDPSFRIEFEMV